MTIPYSRALILALAFVAAGCGGGDDTPESATPAPVAAPTIQQSGDDAPAAEVASNVPQLKSQAQAQRPPVVTTTDPKALEVLGAIRKDASKLTSFNVTFESKQDYHAFPPDVPDYLAGIQSVTVSGTMIGQGDAFRLEALTQNDSRELSPEEAVFEEPNADAPVKYAFDSTQFMIQDDRMMEMQIHPQPTGISPNPYTYGLGFGNVPPSLQSHAMIPIDQIEWTFVGPETVNGHECIRLDGKSASEVYTAVTSVWVAPKMGHVLVRASTTYTLRQQSAIKSQVADYEAVNLSEVTPGVWLVLTAKLNTQGVQSDDSKELYNENTVTITVNDVNTPQAPEVFRLEAPANYSIVDMTGINQN